MTGISFMTTRGFLFYDIGSSKLLDYINKQELDDINVILTLTNDLDFFNKYNNCIFIDSLRLDLKNKTKIQIIQDLIKQIETCSVDEVHVKLKDEVVNTHVNMIQYFFNQLYTTSKIKSIQDLCIPTIRFGKAISQLINKVENYKKVLISQ